MTKVLRDVLRQTDDARLAEDLIYLESWEHAPQPGSVAALRVAQLRRANPALAAAIRAELRGRAD